MCIHHRLVQALVDDYKVLWPSGKSSTYDECVEDTIFGCNEGVVVFDEAADFRNSGPKFNAAMRLADLMSTTILLTATPIVTRPAVSLTLLASERC